MYEAEEFIGQLIVKCHVSVAENLSICVIPTLGDFRKDRSLLYNLSVDQSV